MSIINVSCLQISLPKEELRNFSKLYNPVTIAKLQDMYPYFAWMRYINTFLNGSKISSHEIVILQSPGYIYALEKLLINTPRRFQIRHV